MHNNPCILQDRIPIQYLEKISPDLALEMRLHNQGKILQKDTIHFCGLICTSSAESYVFVPRKAKKESALENQSIARETMRVLAKYGRDTQRRKGIASKDDSDAGLISTIQELADDFKNYGIFSERVRYKTKNSGKPNWVRTTVNEIALFSSNGNIIYPNIQTSRILNANDSILSCIQAAVLLEISEKHGWWLEGILSREAELKSYKTPVTPRFLWVKKLQTLLPNLFAQRAIRLVHYLISYLEKKPRHNNGIILYGVEDFHVVWERMLRDVIPGVEGGWNSRLPKTAFRHSLSGQLQIQERGMQTDLIVRDGDSLKVLDAKYYDATTVSNSPGWPDIVKQLFYHLSLISVVDNDVKNGSFIFPSNSNDEGPFSEVLVIKENELPIKQFPRINCIYLNIVEVMRSYLELRKILIQIP